MGAPVTSFVISCIAFVLLLLFSLIASFGIRKDAREIAAMDTSWSNRKKVDERQQAYTLGVKMVFYSWFGTLAAAIAAVWFYNN